MTVLDSTSEWRGFVDGAVAEALAGADKLCAVVDEETEPYKSKYAAVGVLQDIQTKVQERWSTAGDKALGEDDTKEAAKLAGLLALRIGNLHIDTEMTADGEKELTRALDALKIGEEEDNRAALVETYNALGVLWCNRSEMDRAKEYLDKAGEIYRKERQARRQQGVEDDAVDHTAHLEKQHTLTLFYLAQVFGFKKDPVLSAEYCGATLGRQLKEGEFSRGEWAQNCTQLAGYYIVNGQWGTGERCLTAAEIVLREGGKAEEGDKDVAANVAMGWGRLYLQRLNASRDLSMLGPVDGAPEEERPIPPTLEFPGLGVPPLLRDSEGEPVLAEGFEQARTLFNGAMRWFNKGLQYYVLDGFVSEHCNLLMDKSAMYKLLVYWEGDAHRVCVMHRQRTKLVEPVVDKLNTQHFDQIVRQMRYELAESWREIMETKRDSKRPHVKVAAAGFKCIRWYESFMSAFHDKDGKLPDRIADPETESWYLGAWFNLCGVLHKVQAPTRELAQGNVDMVRRSVKEYEGLVEYVERNQVENYAEELSLCKEMVTLLPDKVAMLSK